MKKGGNAAIEALEARLGHQFADRKLIRAALTHPSAPGAKGMQYERLEFLGDQILGLVVTEALFDSFPKASEGELSRRRASLVRKETCAEVAVELGLPEVIRMGGLPQGRGHTTNVLGDVTEALIAALYLDGGIEPARNLILRYWTDRIGQSDGSRRDPKSTLQEWAQRLGKGPPTYDIVERVGPAHDTRFTVEVSIQDFAPAQAVGRSRREAEQLAAAAVLVREGVWKAVPDGG